MAKTFYATDPFAALGLTRDASPHVIKTRYHELARRYHPNRNVADDTAPSTVKLLAERSNGDTSIASLNEHFSRINQAYTLLIGEVQRRRYIQWSALEEQNAKLDEHRKHLEYVDLYGESSSDESSSDLEVFDGGDGPKSRRGRSPNKDDEKGSWLEAQHNDTVREAAAARRKRLTHLRRKELAIFEAYREAKLAEMDAQIESERLEDLYERAKSKRERFEQIPRTNPRLRMIRTILRATKMLSSTLKTGDREKLLKPAADDVASNSDRKRHGANINKPVGRSGTLHHLHGFGNAGDQTESEDEAPILRSRRRRYKSPIPVAIPPSRDVSPQPQPASILHPIGESNRSWTQEPVSTLSDDDDDDGVPRNDTADAPDPRFRLIVKRPTGFDGLGIEEFISSVSPKPTSRPKTPPVNTCLEMIHLPNGISFEHPGRRDGSADGEGGLDGSNESDSDSSPARKSIFKIKIIGDIRFQKSIPIAHVHKLDLQEESRLLGTPLDIDTDPQSLLEQMAAWDKSLTAQFMVKPDIKASFAFRLVCDARNASRQDHRSFIALSYRRKTIVDKQNDAYSLPLTPEMMQAVWEERVSEEEGLWIDQICIDQDSKWERDISMSAMDLVYRAARVVVVVLDDFEFTASEARALLSHMKEYARMKGVSPHRRFRRRSPPYLTTNNELRGIVTKILSTSWFRRAWCRHEMRLARDLVFLCPSESFTDRGKSVLRLRVPCLAHLLALAAEIPFTTDVEMLKPALLAFFKATPSANKHHGYDKRLQYGNFTSVAADIFRMEAGGDPRLPPERQKAGARWDRMSIILNTMECGLALKPLSDGSRRLITDADCHYSLLMLALAARDPGALCSAGRPLHLKSPAGGEISSWLFEPTFDDSMQQQQQASKRLALGSSIRSGLRGGDHWIQLDLKFVNSGRQIKRHTFANVPETFKLAQGFFSRCKKENWGLERHAWLFRDKELAEEFGSMKEIWVQTLTGVFCCGPEWMSEIAHRFGFSKWKQDLQPAYWLMVNLCSMNGHWPENKDNWTPRAASFIMNFVYSLIIRGLPHKQLNTRPQFWRPVWLTLRNRGQVLVFAPEERDEIHHVVPGVLLDTGYRDLKRLWTLSSRDAAKNHWTLLGKSCLFADDLATRVINAEDDQFRHHQTVYGQATR